MPFDPHQLISRCLRTVSEAAERYCKITGGTASDLKECVIQMAIYHDLMNEKYNIVPEYPTSKLIEKSMNFKSKSEQINKIRKGRIDIMLLENASKDSPVIGAIELKLWKASDIDMCRIDTIMNTFESCRFVACLTFVDRPIENTYISDLEKNSIYRKNCFKEEQCNPNVLTKQGNPCSIIAQYQIRKGNLPDLLI